MRESFAFGTYYPAESVVHRLDPRTKFLGALAATIIGFCALTPWSLAVICVFTVAFYALAKVPPRVALSAVAPLLFIVVITVLLNLLFIQGGDVLAQLGPIAISEQGVHNAVFFGVRLTVFLLIMCLLTLSTTSLDIADSFESLLAPFRRLGVPAREFSLMLGIALGFMPRFSREFTQIRLAQRSRGSKLPGARKNRATGLTALLVPLFTSVFRHAETLSRAMDARCYRGGVGRTRLHPFAFAPRDGWAALSLVLMLAAVLVGNIV